MAAGRLDVILGLDAAQFTTGLTRAEREAEKFQRNMTALGSKIGLAVGAGLSAAVAGVVALTKSSIDAADKLYDLSRATGVSVENLGGIGFAASQAGSDLDGVAHAFGKLNLKIAEAARGEKEAAAAFKAIGISIKDAAGQTKSADAIFKEVATSFASYADGPEKAALGNALFGKSYQAILPLLADGGQALQDNIEYYKRFGGTTTETAKAADQFNDTLGKLSLVAGQLGRNLASELLTPLQAVADAMLKSAENSGAAAVAATAVRKTFEFLAIAVAGVGKVFEIAGIFIGGFIAAMQAVGRRDIEGFNAISKAVREDIARAGKEMDAFAAKVQGFAPGPSLASIKGVVNPDRELERLTRAPVTAPRLPGGGGGGSKTDKAAQLAKKQLDEQLSQLDNFIKREDRLLDERNHSLDRLYDQDRISIQDYFAGRSQALDDATFETADIYREQIANLRKFVSETKDETLKLAALKELGNKQERQADFLSESSRKATKLRDDAAKALDAYGAKVAEVRLKVLELAGAEANAAEIAARRFDASNADLLSQANRQGDEETKRNLALLRQRAIDQTKVNALLERSQVIQQNLGTAEGRLALERDLGLRSELDTYTELGKARSASVAQLQKMADEYSAMAAAFKDPAMIAQAKAFQLSIDELAASVDVLGNRIRNEFKDSFNSAFEGLLNDLAEGKNALDSFKEFFKNFTNDIIRGVNRIAAQSVTDALFKGNGSSGGAGYGTLFANFFAGLLGGGGGGTVSGARPEWLYASGTNFVPRDGLAYLHRGERVVQASENKQWKGGGSIVINQQFAPGTTRDTVNQAAARAGQSVQRAQMRGIA